MVTPINDKTLLPLFFLLLCKYRSVESCTYDQIVVHLILLLLMPLPGISHYHIYISILRLPAKHALCLL